MGQHNARKTQCKNGHQFTKENTYVYPSGGRACRVCLRALARKRAASHPEEGPKRAKKYYGANRSKILERSKRYTRANQSRRIDNARRRGLLKFGLSAKNYDELLESQGRRCAICRDPAKKLPMRLAVDHCHVTGMIRGLLCSRCNMGLGMFRDDQEIMTNAINYLAHSWSENPGTLYKDASD